MIADLPRYPEYKDSGASWLGDVPEGWGVRRIKTLFRERDQRSGDGVGVLLSLTRARGIVPQADASNRMASADDLSKYKVCRPGDLVMNRMQAWSGMFALAGIPGLVSPDYSVFEASGSSNVKYFEHLFKTPILVDEFARRSKGIGSGFNRLYTPDFGAVPVMVPPLHEQVAIVRFLDYADRRIRRYVVAKTKLVALLNEQKQAMIHRAVTRGLDPSVRLKPSGVDWLGEVPDHWGVVRLKWLGAVRIGLTYSPDDVVGEGGSLVLRASNVHKGRVVAADDVYVSTEVPDALRVAEGDILICVRSGSRNLVGKSALITRAYSGATYGAFMSLLKSKDNPFLFWVLNSNMLPSVMAQFETSTINQLTQSDLRNLVVSFPPDPERLEIAAALRSTTAIVERAIAHALREVAQLRELRTRLIADVVTGKLDVREAAAKLPAEVDEAELLDDTDALAQGDESEDEAELDAVVGKVEA